MGLTSTIASNAAGRWDLLKAALCGIVTGVVTPLLQSLIDEMSGSPGDVRIALLAAPFAILVLALVRQHSSNAWWAAGLAAAITVVAFVCAVNAATWVDGQMQDSEKAIRNVLSGLGGGFVGSSTMSVGIGLLPASPRDLSAWLPMLVIGTVAGALLAVDNGLDLNLLSVLYPVWQAGIAIGLVMALQRVNEF